MSAGWHGGSDTRWRTFRATVLARDRYLCTIRDKGCTVHAPLRGGHVDHIVPLSMGGAKYDLANVRAACRSCNLKRGKATVNDEPATVRVSSW